jgi:Zn finger protein HypA/HybF involved in hydrogenase expression
MKKKTAKIVFLNDHREKSSGFILCLKRKCHEGREATVPKVKWPSNTQKCPKCGSDEVVLITGHIERVELSDKGCRYLE